MSKGWVSLYRKTLDNPILKTSKKFSTFEAWVWLLLNANHKERKVVMGTSIYKVKKGAMITSMRKLCKVFGWGNSRLRTFLILLQKDDMIVVKTNHSLTQITLLNYELLQDNKSVTNQKQDTNKSLPNTNNNVNNENKERRESKFNIRVSEIFDEKVRQFMIKHGWDKLSRKELEGKVSEALELLMKLGQVEQLVGDDGEFYYRSVRGKTK